MTDIEFEKWLNNPITKEVFSNLREMAISLKSIMGDGGTLYDNADKTLKETAYFAGRIEGLETVLNLKNEDMEKEDIFDQ